MDTLLFQTVLDWVWTLTLRSFPNIPIIRKISCRSSNQAGRSVKGKGSALRSFQAAAPSGKSPLSRGRRGCPWAFQCHVRYRTSHCTPEGVKNSKRAGVGRARLPPSLMEPGLATRRLGGSLALPIFSHLPFKGGIVHFHWLWRRLAAWTTSMKWLPAGSHQLRLERRWVEQFG